MRILNRTQGSKDADLAEYRAKGIDQVNALAEVVRAIFVTNIIGQEMIYIRKEEEARAYLSADPEPEDLTDYPFIAAEIGSTGETAHQVAQVYVNLANQWAQLGSEMERARISSINYIESAPDTATIDEEIETIRIAIDELATRTDF